MVIIVAPGTLNAQAKGAESVTAQHMIEMSEEYGIDEELFARFRT